MRINTVQKLYHGTDQEFEIFDFSLAKGFKDFGKGFYLTSNLQQAQRWAQKKGDRKSKAYIYCYNVMKLEDESIKILELLHYDKEWVDFISKSRIDGYETDYDIIYDRMADSQYVDIADSLHDYVDHKITSDEVIHRIKWDKFNADQYCFKSEKALALLYNKRVIVQYKDEAGKWTQEL